MRTAAWIDHLRPSGATAAIHPEADTTIAAATASVHREDPWTRDRCAEREPPLSTHCRLLTASAYGR